MFSFRQSLVGLAGLLAVVVTSAALLPHTGRGQGGNPLTRDLRKSYYLTQTTHNGGQALTACAAGYHMASLWEIFDTSNLRYDTELGFTQADSGFGPPAGDDARGWIRTGRVAASSSNTGANCFAYTSSSSELGQLGTTAFLPDFWDTPPVTVIAPWQANATQCSAARRVWCVQD